MSEEASGYFRYSVPARIFLTARSKEEFRDRLDSLVAPDHGGIELGQFMGCAYPDDEAEITEESGDAFPA